MYAAQEDRWQKRKLPYWLKATVFEVRNIFRSSPYINLPWCQRLVASCRLFHLLALSRCLSARHGTCPQAAALWHINCYPVRRPRQGQRPRRHMIHCARRPSLGHGRKTLGKPFVGNREGQALRLQKKNLMFEPGIAGSALCAHACRGFEDIDSVRNRMILNGRSGGGSAMEDIACRNRGSCDKSRPGPYEFRWSRGLGLIATRDDPGTADGTGQVWKCP